MSRLTFAALSNPTPGSALNVCAMWPLASFCRETPILA